MKFYCYLLLTFFTVAAFQPVQAQRGKNKTVIEAPTFPMDATGQITYTEVVDLAGTPATHYKKGSAWFSSFYKSPSSVIKEKNEPESINGTGRFFIKYTDPKSGAKSNAGTIMYDIKIDFKEGKYRYLINRLGVKKASFYGVENWVKENEAEYDAKHADYLVQIDEYFKALVVDLKAKMAAAPAATGDDW